MEVYGARQSEHVLIKNIPLNGSQALQIQKNTTEHEENTEHFIWIVFDFSGILLCQIRGHQDLGWIVFLKQLHIQN